MLFLVNYVTLRLATALLVEGLIVIGPDGVTVKAIVDVTTLALTGLTVIGTLMVVLRRIVRPKRRV